MSRSIRDDRDQLLLACLPFVPAHGWTRAAVDAGITAAKLPAQKFLALCPGGIDDLVVGFADYLDRQMLAKLAKRKPETMRVRDRIEAAVLARLAAAEPYKDAVRLTLAYWSVPPRSLRAPQIVWRTADAMWAWAGDTSTDYNRYTKRGLLAGVITATTLVWLKDSSDDHEVTRMFLANRIDNVLKLGQMIGQFKAK
jgi:ubiquinone biosynthesis protein COQ9